MTGRALDDEAAPRLRSSCSKPDGLLMVAGKPICIGRRAKNASMDGDDRPSGTYDDFMTVDASAQYDLFVLCGLRPCDGARGRREGAACHSFPAKHPTQGLRETLSIGPGQCHRGGLGGKDRSSGPLESLNFVTTGMLPASCEALNLSR